MGRDFTPEEVERSDATGMLRPLRGRRTMHRRSEPVVSLRSTTG